MNAKELAARLNGGEYLQTITSDILHLASESNLVVVHAVSDDGMAINGAINDDRHSFGGGEFLIDADGFLPVWDNLTNPRESYAERYFKRKKSAHKLKAVWRGDDTKSEYAWTYETDIPHEKFDILEDGKKWCRAIVFHVNDLKPSGDESLQMNCSGCGISHDVLCRYCQHCGRKLLYSEKEADLRIEHVEPMSFDDLWKNACSLSGNVSFESKIAARNVYSLAIGNVSDALGLGLEKRPLEEVLRSIAQLQERSNVVEELSEDKRNLKKLLLETHSAYRELRDEAVYVKNKIGKRGETHCAQRLENAIVKLKDLGRGCHFDCEKFGLPEKHGPGENCKECPHGPPPF